MRNFWVMAGLALLLTGCLGKLEKMTEETKEAVLKSNETIEATHKGQTLGAAITFFTDRTRSPAMRAASGETMIVLAPEDRLFLYVGAPRPLNFYMFEPYLPNVSFVGSLVQPVRGVRPIFPEDQKILASSCISGMTFLKGQAIQANANLDEIKTKAEKALLACPAIFGARAQFGDLKDFKHSDKTSWPRTDAQEAERLEEQVKGEELMRGLAALPMFDSVFRDKIDTMIEVKVKNNYTRIDPTVEDE
jgi:hypothetical protein